MARKATSSSGTSARSKPAARKASTGKSVSRPARASGSGGRSRSSDSDGAADAFLKILQSPIVADLLAVAATAALAALAEHGFSSRGTSDERRAGKAMKEAGKAAALAIGRRLSTEVDEIRKASKAKRGATS